MKGVVTPNELPCLPTDLLSDLVILEVPIGELSLLGRCRAGIKELNSWSAMKLCLWDRPDLIGRRRGLRLDLEPVFTGVPVRPEASEDGSCIGKVRRSYKQASLLASCERSLPICIVLRYGIMTLEGKWFKGSCDSGDWVSCTNSHQDHFLQLQQHRESAYRVVYLSSKSLWQWSTHYRCGERSDIALASCNRSLDLLCTSKPSHLVVKEETENKSTVLRVNINRKKQVCSCDSPCRASRVVCIHMYNITAINMSGVTFDIDESFCALTVAVQ